MSSRTVLAVTPAQHLRATLNAFAPHVRDGLPVLLCAKPNRQQPTLTSRGSHSPQHAFAGPWGVHGAEREEIVAYLDPHPHGNASLINH